MNDVPELLHFRVSHYNEKARWALDYKGIEHERRAPPSNYLIQIWRATGQGKLPVLQMTLSLLCRQGEGPARKHRAGRCPGRRRVAGARSCS